MLRKVLCAPRQGGYLLSFNAMASPCEVLVDLNDKKLALLIGHQVAEEAWRIEDKFSRYQKQSVCGQLNAKAGQRCEIDEETYLLLQFADQCYQMSDGLFDITSGILRQAWRFDCSNKLPTQQQINSLLPFIGWQRITFDEHSFQMLLNMEIDFGGIGKEYAVDKAMNIAKDLTNVPVLINFGGDLAVNGCRAKGEPWSIGVEHPSLDSEQSMVVTLSRGAIATSGDAQRFLLKKGKRYSHILNVKTGWPVENPPKSITVAAPKCIQAGLLSTLALLQGEAAGDYLKAHDIKYWLMT